MYRRRFPTLPFANVNLAVSDMLILYTCFMSALAGCTELCAVPDKGNVAGLWSVRAVLSKCLPRMPPPLTTPFT